MADLSGVHRYAAGGLFALALSQAQVQQHTAFELASNTDSNDNQQSGTSFFDEPWTSWCSPEHGLLRHIFRFLGIDEKAWVGLEITSMSPDGKHQIGAYLRLLSEEESDSSSSNGVRRTMEDAGNAHHGDPSKSRAEEAGTSSEYKSRFSEAEVMTKQRKIAVMHELLMACISDVPNDSGVKAPKYGYDARQRVALRLLALWLNIEWSKVVNLELMVAHIAMASQKEREQTHNDDEEVAKSRWQRLKRGSIIGGAAATGGVLLFITGGLAAPAIAAGMAAVGTAVPALGGLAAAAAVAGTTMGSVAVAASFGAAGAGLTGFKMARRTGGIEEFEFEPIGENHQQGRLAVAILVSGIAFDPHDFVEPWEGPDADLERYCLHWESEHVLAVSTAIQDWLTSNVAMQLMSRGAMYTVLGSLVAALAWPATLLSATDFIDSKWTIAINRSDKVGKILAKALLKGAQGNRPVTLMGFSLGARVIFSCLEELVKQGNEGGIIECVVLLGAPLILNKARWEKVRQVVAGRFINGYSTNDWMLGVVYRANFLSQGLAGLQAVDVPGIENVDVTDIVKGHSSYLEKAGDIVQALDIDSFYPHHNRKLQGSAQL
ncbi:hypothetical protein M758_9G023400 [Ceratodon purpureus]|nr:hypothetical protein M758_9G023400 [Ceratodon purpureus]